MSSSPQPALIRIATRGSHLALAQAEMVLALCRAACPRLRFELRILKTTGDRLQRASMATPGKLPKGLFTKELETALLAGEADLAVHSLKDLPTELPDGLRLAAVLERADPRDVLVVRAADLPATGAPVSALDLLPTGATVATSSTRRVAQLRTRRPDLRFVEIRGNVPTRLQKLERTTDFHATLLAAAGLARLGITADAAGRLSPPPAWPPADWSSLVAAVPLEFDAMLPAPGQAAIGLECRSGDRRIAALCARLNHSATFDCVRAERAFLAGFGGGCQSPLAALAQPARAGLSFRAVVFAGNSAWKTTLTLPRRSPLAEARQLGQQARRHLAAGV